MTTTTTPPHHCSPGNQVNTSGSCTHHPPNWKLPSNSSLSLSPSLIHLDHAVDLSHKPEARKEPNGPGQQEEQKDHNERVAEIEECRRRVLNL